MHRRIVVQSLWIGESLSSMEVMTLKSHLWAGGHDFHLYTYGPVKNVPEGVKIMDGNEILPKEDIFSYQTELGKGSFSAFSNYFRYKLLLERGGWWVDSDVLCLRPFTRFDHKFCPPLLCMERQRAAPGYHIASCVIYCPKQNDLMKYCWEEANKKDRSKIVWGEIGPKLLSEAYDNYRDKCCLLPPESFCPIDWYNVEFLVKDDHRGPYVDLRTSFAVHLWNEMWRRNGMDKDAKYQDHTLYQKWRNEYDDL